tara:strand:- start:446 stop:1210 length:765 start_codon:yes stop_codon:yes gene_type:complete
MKYSIFILSHQDDEFGVFEIIRKAILKKEKVIIFYMTNGAINKSIPKFKFYNRDLESLGVLKEIGVKENNVIFFGRLNNIPTCCLHKKLKHAYLNLNKYFKKYNGKIKLYTHAWEGGNEDHDACYILVKKIIKNSKKIKAAYQFPLYNANTNLFYYSVQRIIEVNGKAIRIKVNLLDRLKYIKFLFYYKSQIRVWIGLYPFLIFNFLTRNYCILQKINEKKSIEKPHKGTLLYEKFRNSKYKNLQKNFLFFLKK